MAMRHKAVVLVVVDLVDFDGSFPRAIMDVVTDSGAEVVLVITKVDLVPRYLGVILTLRETGCFGFIWPNRGYFRLLVTRECDVSLGVCNCLVTIGLPAGTKGGAAGGVWSAHALLSAAHAVCTPGTTPTLILTQTPTRCGTRRGHHPGIILILIPTLISMKSSTRRVRRG